MGLDKNHIPDEYLCEVCEPRPVDRKRARALQARRRAEIYHANSSSSDNDNNRAAGASILKANHKTMLTPGSKAAKGKKAMADRKNDLSKAKGGSSKAKVSAGKSLLNANSSNSKSLNSRKSGDVKKVSANPANRKRRPSGDIKKKNPNSSSQQTPKKVSNNRRKSSQDFRRTDDEDEDDDEAGINSDDSDLLLEPRHDAGQHLRSWIDQYEEAMTNHYTPEIRARLEGGSSAGGRGFYEGGVRVKELSNLAKYGPKCNVSLKGNGVKVRVKSFLACARHSFCIFIARINKAMHN